MKLCLGTVQFGMDYGILGLQYVKQETGITHLVFGADSKEQVWEDIRMFQNPFPADILEDIGNEFDNIEADIVMPSLWKR